MDKKQLIEYLNEFKAELQDMFEEFDHEMGNHEDDALYQDAYEAIGKQVEDAIDGVDTLISDIEDGKYDDIVDDGNYYQEYGGNE